MCSTAMLQQTQQIMVQVPAQLGDNVLRKRPVSIRRSRDPGAQEVCEPLHYYPS